MNKPSSRNWIWIRGLGRGSIHWGEFVQTFQKLYPEDQVEFLDLPGNGENYDLTSPLSIKEYVRVLRSQSEFIKETKPIHLLAMSLGAMVATCWGEMYPHEIEKMVLVTTSSRGLCPIYQRLKLNIWGQILSLVLIKDDFQRESRILSIVSNSVQTPTKYAKVFADFAFQHPLSFLNFTKQLIAASRYQFPAQAPVPTLLIGSSLDQFVDCRCTLQLAKTWGLSARIHPTAGHDIPLDDPDWLAQQLN